MVSICQTNSFCDLSPKLLSSFLWVLTIIRWQRIFLWCSLCSLNFQRQDRTCSPDWAYQSSYWIELLDNVWIHMLRKYPLGYILTTLWRNSNVHFWHHSCWQTRRRLLFCLRQSLDLGPDFWHFRCNTAWKTPKFKKYYLTFLFHLISTYHVSSAKLESQSAQRMKSLMPFLNFLTVSNVRLPTWYDHYANFTWRKNLPLQWIG